MKFLLDSNAVIAVLRRDPQLIGRLRAHEAGDFGISTLVWHELFYGAYRSQRVEHHLNQIDGLPLQPVEFDREDARRAGQVRAQLAGAGAPIGPIDVLIAGQALARDLTLITHNIREFIRVPNLRVEDWE